MIIVTSKHQYTYTKSKRMLKWFYKWVMSEHRSIITVFKKPCQEKLLIEDYIKSYIKADEYRVINSNSFNFTCGYKIYYKGTEYFCVHTWRNSFIISANDLTALFDKQSRSDESLKIKTKSL